MKPRVNLGAREIPRPSRKVRSNSFSIIHELQFAQLSINLGESVKMKNVPQSRKAERTISSTHSEIYDSSNYDSDEEDDENTTVLSDFDVS